MEFMNGMIQWLTLTVLVSLLDESVFLNEWFKDKVFNKKKNKKKENR